MELYPPHLLQHLSPLVFIQGLGLHNDDFPIQNFPDSVGGDPIIRAFPLIQLNHVTDLIKIWRKFHIDGVLWSSNSTKTQLPTHPHRYKFKFIENNYQLLKYNEEISNNNISINWFYKFQCQIPTIFISFYEINEDEKNDELLIEEILNLKNQLLKRNIKLLIIITSSKIISIESRIENFRRKTGLNNRNGLLVLSPDFKLKELNIFALEILQIIKLSSSDFYSLIDKKLRKDRLKLISELNDTSNNNNTNNNNNTKSNIEIKYCLKIAFINELKGNYDQSSKHYETCYENLIDLFNGDLKIDDENWYNSRLLLDFSVFHIVRNNFYLEYPNISFRKFDIHIKSVLYFLFNNNDISNSSFQTLNWLGSQYKWLAQLSDLAPTSLIPSDYPFKFDVTVSNRLSPLLLPHPGYLYLQVVDYYKKRSNLENDNKDPYFLFNNNDDLINLLTFAKLAFQKKDNSFNRTIASINFEIAQEFFKRNEFEKSFKFFELTLDSVKEDDWGYLLGFIHFSLFKCSINLKKIYSSILNFLELCLINENLIDLNIFNEISKFNFNDLLIDNNEPIIINATTDSTFDLFESKILFKHEEISLSNNSVLQINLISKLNNLIKVSNLNDLSINFNGNSFQSILIKHDASLPNQSFIKISDLKFDENLNSSICFMNLNFKPYEEKIIQINLPITKQIGFNEVNSITSILNFNEIFKVKLNIPIWKNLFQKRFVWYEDEYNKKILNSNDPVIINVIPRIPNVSINFKKIPKFIIIGEKLQLNLEILDKDDELIDLNLELELNNDLISYKWDDDNESKILKLKNLEKNKSYNKILSLSIPQDYKLLDNNNLTIKLKSTYFINEDYDIPSFKIMNLNFIIIDPFKINVSIQPRLKDPTEEINTKKLNLKDNSNLDSKPIRFWLFKFSTFIDLKTPLNIINEELIVKAENEQIKINEFKDLKKEEKIDNKLISSYYLDTEILDDHTYRNVQLEVKFQFNYKREDSDELSTYVNEPWKLSLPLLDPRVLLSIENLNNKNLKLVFILENPTSKVFSFSTSLLENRHFNLISGTKQISNLTINPLEKEIIPFEIQLNTSEATSKWHQLPQLRVYDVNYRVNLPTLIATDTKEIQTQTHKGDIFIFI